MLPGPLPDPPPAPSPRWILIALVLSLFVMAVERHAHAPIALAAVGWHDAWGAYRAHLIHRGIAATSIGQYRIRLNTWRYWLWHPPRGRHRKEWWQGGPADLDAFLARKCQPKHLHAGQPLSVASKAMYSRAVPPLYRVCYSKGLIDADPFAGYEPLPPPRPAPRPLDLGQVRVLLGYTRDHPDPRLYPAVALCYYDALRSGEPTELLVEDVELEGEVPRINLLGKGHDARDWFPLQQGTLPALIPYLAWLASRHGVGDWRQIPAGTPLFQSLTKVGAPIGRSYLTRLLARAMRDAGVAGRPHDLRRSAGNAVGEAYDDNPGPLKAVLRHRGYTALDAYRVPSLGRVQRYLEQIPDPLAEQ
jgi:integrase